MRRHLALFDPSALFAVVDNSADPITTIFEDELYDLQRKLAVRMTQVTNELVRTILLLNPLPYDISALERYHGARYSVI